MKAIVHTSLIRKDGGMTGFRGIVVDITARLELEACPQGERGKIPGPDRKHPDVLFSPTLTAS